MNAGSIVSTPYGVSDEGRAVVLRAQVDHARKVAAAGEADAKIVRDALVRNPFGPKHFNLSKSMRLKRLAPELASRLEVEAKGG